VAAGVNEVTLFRTFGSKAALIDEAVRCCAASAVASRSALPELPVDPERELAEWAGALLRHLRETRSLMRKSMSEVEERPDMAPCMAAGVSLAADELRTYMRRLGELGFVDWRALGTDDVDAHGSDDGSNDPGPRSAGHAKMQPADAAADAAAAAVAVVERVDSVRAEDAYAAGTMLMAALFSDAMGRDLMPGLYPEPADRAPALYVRLFLRAVRCARTPRRRARPTSSARTSKVRS